MEPCRVPGLVPLHVPAGTPSPQPFRFVITDRDGHIEPLEVTSQFSHR